jgi:chaperonin GroES
MHVLDNKILCEIEEKDKKAGEIIAPAHTKKKRESSVLKVIATGPGRLLESGGRDDMQVKVGDRVIIGAVPLMTRINGKVYAICEQFDILMVLGRSPPND